MQIKNLLFKDFIRLVYKVLIIVLRKIQSRFPPTVACFFQNVLMFLVQSKVRFNFDKTSKLYPETRCLARIKKYNPNCGIVGTT